MNIFLEYCFRISDVIEQIFPKILAGRCKPLLLVSWQKSTRTPSLVQAPLTVFSSPLLLLTLLLFTLLLQSVFLLTHLKVFGPYSC